jgi:hypothetical protein
MKLAVIILCLIAGWCRAEPVVTVMNGKYVIEIAEECPEVLMKATAAAYGFDRTDGCVIRDAQVIYNPLRDPALSWHEKEHINGMEHGPVERRGDLNCSQVLAGGNTQWRVGDWICRNHRGGFERGRP